MYSRESVCAIYNSDYAETYDRLYLDSCLDKHEINSKMLQLVMRDLPATGGRWVDVCCGQAWHFANVASPMAKIGVDISDSQLQRASRRNPGVSFVQADVTEFKLRARSVTLATSFWAAYCYLNDDATIMGVFEEVISWISPGGAMYIEVLLPEVLQAFNATPYAVSTGFQVMPRTPDYRSWSYRDSGGEHIMRSPPLDAFANLFRAHFERVGWTRMGFMVHFVARGRRAG